MHLSLKLHNSAMPDSATTSCLELACSCLCLLIWRACRTWLFQAGHQHSQHQADLQQEACYDAAGSAAAGNGSGRSVSGRGHRAQAHTRAAAGGSSSGTAAAGAGQNIIRGDLIVQHQHQNGARQHGRLWANMSGAVWRHTPANGMVVVAPGIAYLIENCNSSWCQAKPQQAAHSILTLLPLPCLLLLVVAADGC